MACSEEITDCEIMKSLNGVETILKKLLRLNGDCLSLNTQSTPALTNESISDALIEADDNTALQVAIAAWRTANPTKKQIAITQVNSINKQAVIISYTS